MRAMLMAAMGLAVGFTLFGCDQNPQQTQTAATAPVAVAPPAPCKCQQADTTSATRVAHRHVYGHRYRHTARYRHHGHTLSEFLAYSTGPSSYGASDSSSSVREYRPGDEERYEESSRSETRVSGAQYQQGSSSDAWLDGYGKAHYADFGPLDDEHPGLIANKDERERQKVWRGYNSKCDNRIN